MAEPGTFDPLRALTWNICGDTKAWRAPVDDKDWSAEDKRAALQQDVLELQPQIIALQECASEEALPRLLERYTLVGAAKSHANYIHLYPLKKLEATRMEISGGVPAVMGCVQVGTMTLCIAAVHLSPSPHSAAQRKYELERVTAAVPDDSDALLVLGDLNVYDGSEGPQLWQKRGLKDAEYAGDSWNPRANKFYENQADLRKGEKFDRVLFRGAVVAYSCLVGQHRVFKDGCEFFLSDHFPLLGFVDVHESHRGDTRDQGVGRIRTMVLARYRDLVSAREVQNAKEKERVGRENAALRRAQAADRDLEQLLKQARERAKQVEKKRKQLSREAFGEESLFAEAPSDPAPSPSSWSTRGARAAGEHAWGGVE